MALSLTAEQKNILKIFKIEEEYLIPAYQRPYSWEYDECLTLYNDILNAFKDNEDYFIGNIIIAKSYNNPDILEVIDGQQRLTTLLLFLKVLSIFAPELKPLKASLELEDWETDGSKPRLRTEVFESNDKNELNEVLLFSIDDFEEIYLRCQDKNGDFKASKCKHKFEKNIMFFYDWLKFYISKKNDLKQLIEFILKRVYMLPIELGGENLFEASKKALKIFETLNNRGMSLNDTDIFKAELYKKAKNINKEKEFIEIWKDLRHNCDNLDIELESLFKYYSHITRGKEDKTSNEIGLREFFTTLEYSPFERKNYIEVLNDLFKIVEVIQFIKSEKNEETRLAKWFQLIDKYTNQYPKIALVVYLFIYGLEEKEELEVFLKNLIRFCYYEGSTTTIKFEVYNIIRDICSNKHINTYIKKEVPLKHLDYLGGLRYGYALLAFYLQRDTALPIFTIDQLITIKDENILSSDWNKDKIEKVNYLLGNYIILDLKKRNISIDKKIDYYNSSSVIEVKKISKQLINLSYNDILTRDKELKNILISFFEGKI